MSRWQPIKTAPKDGTEIDLYCVDAMDVGFRVPESSWNPRLSTWEVSGEALHDAVGNEGVRPTHWMHIPEPPVAGP